MVPSSKSFVDLSNDDDDILDLTDDILDLCDDDDDDEPVSFPSHPLPLPVPLPLPSVPKSITKKKSNVILDLCDDDDDQDSMMNDDNNNNNNHDDNDDNDNNDNHNHNHNNNGLEEEKKTEDMIWNVNNYYDSGDYDTNDTNNINNNNNNNNNINNNNNDGNNGSFINHFLVYGVARGQSPAEFIPEMMQVYHCVKNFFNLKHMDWKSAMFKEVMARSQTIDISLKLGALRCQTLENRITGLREFVALQRLYKHHFPSKELSLVNVGYFVSYPGNPGQNPHFDCKTDDILSPVITMLISPEQQLQSNGLTNGSTVFYLGSQHPEKSKYKMEPWFHKKIQPTLKPGEIVCFGGNILHFGGAFNIESNHERIVVYAVFHLISPDEEWSTKDKNIENVLSLESFLAGTVHNILPSLSGQSFEVKKIGWYERKYGGVKNVNNVNNNNNNNKKYE